ncbi:MAG: PHP domain-containing protein [Oscillospiraceae bacterium]|nr:PHP domain-containing protein [Oscillospiraceae bacterium]
MALCDLHTHSTASDGQYTPTELAALVKERGCEAWALTDHDTTDGLAEAARAAAELGLRFVPGIELSAREYHTYHILGYGVDPDADELRALCERMRSGRDERSLRLLDYLKEKGMPLTLDEVEKLAGGEVVGRPHFARAMVARGYVASNREAFDRWLDTDEFHARVERPKPTARECVETICAARGKASLAHPYQIGVDDGTLEQLVKELAGYGLEAIECYYPKFSPEQQDCYLRLAEKYSLHSTGGSDFHGERVKPDTRLDAVELDLDWLL